MKNFVIFCCVLIGLASGGKVRELPSYFKTCKISEPNMAECVMEKSKLSLPGLLKGSKEFKVPSFLPLKLKEVKIDAGNVILALTDFEMYGLDSAELRNVKPDMLKGHTTADIHIDQLGINGTYDVDGRIMVLPIQGHGPGYLQFNNLLISIEFTFTLNEDPDDKQYHYIKITSLDIDYTVEHAFFNFENLFNGNKKLGEEMNIFLNENWPEFNKDLKPAIISVIRSIVLQISSNILEIVPMEKMFPK